MYARKPRKKSRNASEPDASPKAFCDYLSTIICDTIISALHWLGSFSLESDVRPNSLQVEDTEETVSCRAMFWESHVDNMN